MPSPVKDDNALVKMPTLEEILRRGRFCHSSRYRQKPSLSSLHQNRNAAPYTSQSSNRSGVRNGPSGFPKCFGGGHHTTSCLSPSSIPRQNVGDPIRKRTALKCGLHQNKSPVNEWCDRVLELIADSRRKAALTPRRAKANPADYLQPIYRAM